MARNKFNMEDAITSSKSGGGEMEAMWIHLIYLEIESIGFTKGKL